MLRWMASKGALTSLNVRKLMLHPQNAACDGLSRQRNGPGCGECCLFWRIKAKWLIAP